MKTAWKRWGWPLLKAMLALAVLLAVGMRFYNDLANLDFAQLDIHLGWLFLSGTLYLLGLLPSAWYWYHLMHVFGDRPSALPALRAYFMGQLGKYVPGKAMALLVRASYVRGPQTRFGVAIITTFYEVLTTMAAGGLMAAIVFAIYTPDEIPGLDLHPMWTSMLLLAVCGVPLLPGVFNFIVARMARRFEKIDAYQLPRLRFGTLLVGIAAISVGWLALGLSVWTLLYAVLPEPPPLTLEAWLRCAGANGLAYVAGFLVVFLPGGIGAREFLLLRLLRFSGPESFVAMAVLLLRLVWTAAEVVLTSVLLVARTRKSPAPEGERPTRPTANPQAGPRPAHSA